MLSQTEALESTTYVTNYVPCGIGHLELPIVKGSNVTDGEDEVDAGWTVPEVPCSEDSQPVLWNCSGDEQIPGGTVPTQLRWSEIRPKRVGNTLCSSTCWTDRSRAIDW